MVETTTHRAHSKQIKTPTPLTLPLCSPFPLSTLSSHLQACTHQAIFFLAVPSLSELAEESPKPGGEKRKVAVTCDVAGPSLSPL
jgi:hypothetical protein